MEAALWKGLGPVNAAEGSRNQCLSVSEFWWRSGASATGSLPWNTSDWNSILQTIGLFMQNIIEASELQWLE